MALLGLLFIHSLIYVSLFWLEFWLLKRLYVNGLKLQFRLILLYMNFFFSCLRCEFIFQCYSFFKRMKWFFWFSQADYLLLSLPNNKCFYFSGTNRKYVNKSSYFLANFFLCEIP